MMGPRAAAALLLAAVPAAAWADPVSLVTLAVSAAGYITGATIIATAINVGIAVIGAASQRRKARKAAAAQRAAYNASLQDRTVTVLRADPPWQVIYGRCIVGGAIVDIVTTDKTNARREDGSTYTKADAYKHLVIVLAAHECQAIHEVYIDGVPVGALDVNGWATTGEFVKAGAAATDTRQAVFTTSVTLPETPLAVLSAYSVTGSGIDEAYTSQTVTISGNTLNGPAGVQVVCNYTVARTGAAAASVRVSKQLGTASQATDPWLASIAPSRYTANHRLRGLAYIVVTLDLEEPRFQGGPPNITAEVSGRKVYDPRTATTAWSANPALCIRDYITAEWGFGAAAGEVDDAYTIAAANACDEPVDLDVGGVVTAAQPRFTVNGATGSDASPEAVLEDLADAMAGFVAYGGAWQMQAGTWTPPVMDLTDDDLHGMIEIVQADTPVDDLFNGLRGQYVPAGAASPADFNPYRNATFAAADGRDLWTDIALPWTNNLARARNLCRIFVERNRSGQVIRYPAKLKAWPLQVGDRVRVSSTEYGWTLKAFRVTDWEFAAESPVILTLQEDAAETYDLADAAVADPTPNTDLPNPWVVADMAGVGAESGNATLKRLRDGTIVPRVRVYWTARTDAYVLEGGRVEVRWRGPDSLAWAVLRALGTDTEAWIEGVREGDRLVIEVRAVNSFEAASAPAFVAHTVVGKSAAPSNVTGLAYTIKPGQVVVTWAACPDADYARTELRVGASWAAGSYLAAVTGTEYQHPRPANGTYTVWAAHQDSSGNYSAAPASLSVTVTDAIDPVGAATVVLLIYRRNATSPALPSATATYDFPARSLTGLNNSWQASVPAGSDPLWVSTATAYATGGATTDTIAPAEWSTPQILAQDGGPGLTTAAVNLYQRTATSSAPSVSTTGSTTYTFATGAVSGQPAGWSNTVPASGGGYLWVIQATAAGTGATDAIANTEWTSPRLVAQDGDAGADGVRGSLTGYGYGQYGISNASWSDGHANRVINNMLTGASLTTTLATTTHLRIGDTVTLGNGSSFTETRFWSGAAWLLPGTVISGNLLVGGTISGGVNLNITGYGRIEGANPSLSIPDPFNSPSNISRTVALIANTSAASNIAVYGKTTASTSGALWGENSSTSGGYGVLGYGFNGVYGVALPSTASSYGVRGDAGAGSSSTGVYGANSSGGTWAVQAVNQFGGQALRAVGGTHLVASAEQVRLKTGTGATGYGVLLGHDGTNFEIDITASGSADSGPSTTPFQINLATAECRAIKPGGGTVMRLKTGTGTANRAVLLYHDNTDFIVGLTASADADGALSSARPLQVRFSETIYGSTGSSTLIDRLKVNQMQLGTGTATASFPGNNKPGGNSTNTWLTLNINGTTHYIPAWT